MKILDRVNIPDPNGPSNVRIVGYRIEFEEEELDSFGSSHWEGMVPPEEKPSIKEALKQVILKMVADQRARRLR